MKAKPKQNRKVRNILGVACVMAIGLTIYWVTRTSKVSAGPDSPSAATPTVHTEAAQTQPAVPAYYASANAAKPYPKLIPAAYYQRHPLVERAYADAARIPGVLAQQPCYCHCDKSAGHHSLLDCYASDHAARCLICIKEALLAQQMTQRSSTPAEIRQAIIRGEWQSVDVGAASR